MKKYKVSEECIGCRACEEVASENFKINDSNIAYLKLQPENKKQEQQCEDALEICPVEAIYIAEESKKETNEVESNKVEAILASHKVKDVLDKYPDLKQVLIDLSPKFKRMQNPVLYNTLARFANFTDAAKITGVSLCEILHTLNKFIGAEDKLRKSMPECVKGVDYNPEENSIPVSWNENPERYIYNKYSIEDLIKKVSELSSHENIMIVSQERPDELLKVVEGLEFWYNIKKEKEYLVSIFNPKKEKKVAKWQDRMYDFELMDVRGMTTDPFDIIIKKAYEVEDDSGFVLIQRFEPTPMISMLAEMGFDHITEKHSDAEFWIYFHKKPVEAGDVETSSGEKVDAVIQSATPVAYPVIMRLLQSERIRKNINIKELKVWEETEKHLAWITNGKADITFSALITSAKLRNSDIKIPALFVWDNFVILTRKKAKTFEDIKGEEIYTPLFEEAPPAKITKYLIEASGLNVDDYKFTFGKPFGRPEEIYADFVTGKANTVILREPEASYAIKIMQDRNVDISIISFNEIWNKINKGFGSFPNAGLVLKGEFARKYPEHTKIFLEELKDAINWVNENKTASANLSFDMMRQPTDRVELFLNRVNFKYVEGEPLKEKVKQYFDILNAHGITETKVDDDFLKIFELDF